MADVIWFRVTTAFGSAGIATDATGVVVDAAPIWRRVAFRRDEGRLLNDVIRDMRARGWRPEWVRLTPIPAPQPERLHP